MPATADQRSSFEARGGRSATTRAVQNARGRAARALWSDPDESAEEESAAEESAEEERAKERERNEER